MKLIVKLVYLLIFVFFQVRKFETKKKKQNQKNQRRNFKIDERVNSDRGSSY